MQHVLMPGLDPNLLAMLGQPYGGPAPGAALPGLFQSLLTQAMGGITAQPAVQPGVPAVPAPPAANHSLVALLLGQLTDAPPAASPAEAAPAEAAPQAPVTLPLTADPDTSPSTVGADPVLAEWVGYLIAVAQGSQPPLPALPAPAASAVPPAELEAALIRAAAGDPQLEAFVHQVIDNLKGGQPPATAAPESPPATPTFSDLVSLVADQAEALARTTARTAAVPAGSTEESAPPAPDAPEAPAAPSLPEQQSTLLTGGDAQGQAEGFGLEARSEVEGVDIRQRVLQAEQVMRQVVRTVKLMVDGSRSELRLQLHPENLGTVAVKLVLTEGALQATLTARDPAVRQVLQANLDQLRQRFVDQGMKVDQVSVTIGGDSSFSHFDHPHQRQTWDDRSQLWQPRRPWRSEPETSAPVPGPAPRTSGGWYPGRTGARINSLA